MTSDSPAPELIQQLRDLAAGKHDDLSVANDGAAAIQRLTEERDDWKQAHQELVEVRASDLQAVAAKMESVQGEADVGVAKWIIRAELQRKRAEKAEAERDRLRGAVDGLLSWAIMRSDWPIDVENRKRTEPPDHPISIARAALTGEVK